MELDFVVAPPPDRFCPVCMELLTEPFLTDCGHYVCRTCRERIVESGVKDECPSCREPNVIKDTRLNKHLQREIYDLKVRCQHHKVGCKWVGELRNLKDHLNITRRNCEFLILPCSFGCGEQLRSGAMKEHKKCRCPKRGFQCEYCDYHDSRDIVIEKHLPICHQFPVQCPNECEVKELKRIQLKAHVDECPLQVIACPFSSTGCTVTLPRNQMEAHEEQAVRHHLRLVLSKLNDDQEPSTPPTAAAQLSPEYLYNVPPLVFTITDFVKKKEANEMWTSPAYYTHPGGYKVCLKVYINGLKSGKSTHLSVIACLMRGDFDHELEWPFEGDFHVELLDQRDRKHSSHVINLNRFRHKDDMITSRVISKKFGIGHGAMKFFPLADLSYDPSTNTEYLQDDCLLLRVNATTTYSNTLLHRSPSWQDTSQSQSLCEFTLTEFSKRKQFNNRYTSPPFYTHPQGYKMCLLVYANGTSKSGKGTHVEMCTYIMRGEYDQHLQWPFTGDITMELLNWKEDRGHSKKTQSIDVTAGFARVKEGMFGRSRVWRQFISHSFLSYNPTTNTEYLQDDCLRLRVNVPNNS